MPSAHAETFLLRRSPRLTVALVLAHLAAWVALAAWPAPPALRLGLAAAVGAGLAGSLRRPRPVRLSRRADGWSLTDSRGEERRGGVIAGGRLLPGVTVVTFSGGFAGSVVLPADAFAGGDSRGLRALLRHRPGRPA